MYIKEDPVLRAALEIGRCYDGLSICLSRIENDPLPGHPKPLRLFHFVHILSSTVFSNDITADTDCVALRVKIDKAIPLRFSGDPRIAHRDEFLLGMLPKGVVRGQTLEVNLAIEPEQGFRISAGQYLVSIL